MHLWQVGGEAEKSQKLPCGEVVMRVAYSPDGKSLATAGESILIFDGKTGEQRQILKGHRGWVTAIAFVAKGKEMVSTGVDGSVRRWDAETGKELAKVECKGSLAWRLAVGVDEKVAAVSLTDHGEILLWDLRSPLVERKLKIGGEDIGAMAFSRDGKSLLVSCGEKLLSINVATDKEANRVEGHLERIFASDLSRDGNLFVTGSGDGTAMIWNVAEICGAASK